MSRLVILDRDGVINEDSDDYIRNLDQWHPVPGSIDAIAQLYRAGYTVAIATNQSGLSRGYFGLDELEAIHQRLLTLVEQAGGEIAMIAYCPHLPDEGCDCRKPGTGMLRAISRELDMSVEGAYFVGDSLKDLQAGEAANCIPLLVETGKGQRTIAALDDALAAHSLEQRPIIYSNLAEAAKAIIAASS